MSTRSKEFEFERWVSDLIDAMDTGVIVLDTSCNIVFINRYVEAITGMKFDHDGERKIYNFYPQISKEWIVDRVQQVITSRSKSFTSWEGRSFLLDVRPARPFTSGTRYMYQDVTFEPIEDNKGAIRYIVVTLSDVTDSAKNTLRLLKENREYNKLNVQLKKAIDEQKRATKKIRQIQDQLLESEKLASLGIMATGISHELNTPIGYIKSNMNSLQKYSYDIKEFIDQLNNIIDDASIDNETQKIIKSLIISYDIDYIVSDLDNISNESLEGTKHITRIVKDLNKLSFERDHSWELVNIDELLKCALEKCTTQPPEQCEIINSIDTDTILECLPLHIEQALINLLENAFAAINDNGMIYIQTQVIDESIILEITDNGKGISTENLRNIFDPFFTSNEPGKGTGLGLSVVYAVIKAHHGDIDVKSKLGEGTTFTIKLPISRTKESVNTTN